MHLCQIETLLNRLQQDIKFLVHAVLSKVDKNGLFQEKSGLQPYTDTIMLKIEFPATRKEEEKTFQ